MSDLIKAIGASLAARGDSDGFHASGFPGLSLARASEPSQPMHMVYVPSVCFVAQGAKSVLVSDKRLRLRCGSILARRTRDAASTTGHAGDLAAIAHMSPSSFHQHFGELTAMTPIRYQKSLSLLEARRLMIAEHMFVEEAAHRVGYGSPYPFSREYARMFGAPSRRHIVATRW